VHHSLRLGVGNWVDGERFYNRDRELELLMNILSDGDSVSIVAQRRIGKTSLMREAASRMGSKIIALHVDLQKAQTPEDAIVELSVAAQAYEGLGRKAISIISGVVENTLGRIESIKTTVLSVTLRSNLSEENWQRKGDDLFQMLADVAEQQGRLVVIFFDEVPILLNRPSFR
jgi:AAA+ ATPase superfamily predicted ATPase